MSIRAVTLNASLVVAKRPEDHQIKNLGSSISRLQDVFQVPFIPFIVEFNQLISYSEVEAISAATR